MNTNKLNSIKQESYKNLIKQGHHRREPNMKVEVISVDSDDDEWIDVEAFDFDDSMTGSLQFKEEPVFEDVAASMSEETKTNTEKIEAVVATPHFSRKISINRNNAAAANQNSEEKQLQLSLDVSSDKSKSKRKSPSRKEVETQESTKKSKIHQQDKNIDEIFDDKAKKTKNRANQNSDKSDRKESERTSRSRRKSVDETPSRKERVKSAEKHREKSEDMDKRSSKKRKRTETGDDEKPRKKKKELPPDKSSPESKATILLDVDDPNTPLDLKGFNEKNPEIMKETSPVIQQDISNERITNIEDKLNELKILKLKYQLFQLQKLKTSQRSYIPDSPKKNKM
jgi:hypothetical protein